MRSSARCGWRRTAWFARNLRRRSRARSYRSRPDFSSTASAARRSRSRRMVEQPGYLWSFPRRDHLAVGICAPAAAEGHFDGVARAVAERGSSSTTSISAPALTPYAWPIPSIGFEDARSHDILGTRMDAAGGRGGTGGSADARGHLSTRCCRVSGRPTRSSEPRRFARPTRYAERLRTEVQPELARAARLERSLLRPSVFPAFCRRAQTERRRFGTFSRIWSPAFSPTKVCAGGCSGRGNGGWRERQFGWL